VYPANPNLFAPLKRHVRIGDIFLAPLYPEQFPHEWDLSVYPVNNRRITADTGTIPVLMSK
jgi:hypothetical protein